jgi:hypothetical protein
MYRVLLESGEETTLENVEDLLYGIGSGVIGAGAKIYHAHAEKWLPITVHPDYKRATKIIGERSASGTRERSSGSTTRRTRRYRKSKPTPATPQAPVTDPVGAPREPRKRHKSLDGLPLLEPDTPLEEPPELDPAFGPDPLPLQSELGATAPSPGLDVSPSETGETYAETLPSPPPEPVVEPLVVVNKLAPTATGDFDTPEVGERTGELEEVSDLSDDPNAWLPDLEFPEMVSASPIRGRSDARIDRQFAGRRLVLGAVAVLAILVLGWVSVGRLGGNGGGDEDPSIPTSPPPTQPPAESPSQAASQSGDVQVVLPATAGSATSAGAVTLDSGGVARSPETEYVESFAAARAQFDSVMSGINFTGMFAPRRLRTESELLTAMSSIRATMNAVQLYRSREMAIEAAHPDVEVSEQERAEVAHAVDSLLSSMDAAYGLLLSQYGRFRLANGSMLFTNPAAEQEYVDVTRRISRHSRILQRLNREQSTLTGQRIALGVVNSSPPRLGTVIQAPSVQKMPTVDVKVEGPQWDSIEAERRARLTDSVIKAGMEHPPTAPSP